MATIINNDTRQYNLICQINKRSIKEKLTPGINVIDDKKWKSLASSDYVKSLLRDEIIKEDKTDRKPRAKVEEKVAVENQPEPEPDTTE